MDLVDRNIDTFSALPKIHDVIFTGSCIGQGHRKEWLAEINKEVPIKVWGWGHEDWKKMGINTNITAYRETQWDEINKTLGQMVKYHG